MRYGKSLFILFMIIVVAAIISLTPVMSTYSGSHTMEKNRPDPTDMCAKCHEEIVSDVKTNNTHGLVGCICHGYNPNTSESENINLIHNLTKDIYCTNCHTEYDAQGAVVIHQNPVIDAQTQSSHYITDNSTYLKTTAKSFFNRTT